MTDLLSSSSSFFLGFKEAQPRNWNAAKYTREYEYSWKRFWLSAWSTRFWWIIQLFKKFGKHRREPPMMSTILRKEGSENSGSEEPLQSTLLPCFSVIARRKSRRQISLMSMTHHAVGIWTCTQVTWQFQVIYPRRCICNSLTKRSFKAGSWIFKQEFAQKRRISRWYSSGSRDRSNPARWRTSSIQNQLREKISLVRKTEECF